MAELFPADAITRTETIADGLAVHTVEPPIGSTFTLALRASCHLLVVHEQGVRREGETLLADLPPSGRRDLCRRMTFVPAGSDYRDTQEPITRTRSMYVCFDPDTLGSLTDGAAAPPALAPRLLFEDGSLLETALKLKRLLDGPVWAASPDHLGTVGRLLLHEFMLFHRGIAAERPITRGGLAAWQQRRLLAFIDEHRTEQISLGALADIAKLSPHHLCRAFKQSFGLSPLRYHSNRRIDLAKDLLTSRAHSVTNVGLMVGYSETSSFTAAFRKSTGLTPTGFLRSIV